MSLQVLLNAGSPNYRAAYSVWDFVAPLMVVIFFGFIFFAVSRIRSKVEPSYKYLFYSYLLKVLGTILTALMYGLYYKYGDTYGYYDEISIIHNEIGGDPFKIFEALKNVSGRGKSLVKLYKLGFVISLFVGKSYLGIYFAFTVLSTIGNWLIYRLFCEHYPKYSRVLAYLCLYIPSIWFWGTGLIKEPMVIFGLGVILHVFHSVVFKRKFKMIFLFALPLGYYTIMAKPYVFYVLLIMLVAWLGLHKFFKIKSKIIRLFSVSIFSILLTFGIGYVAISNNALMMEVFEEAGIFEQAVNKATGFKMTSKKSDGSAYDLGAVEPTFLGILKKFIPAVNVALFRPYLWEISKPINIPMALESAFCLFFVLFILLKTKIIGGIRIALQSPFLLSCLIYTLLLAFIVGFVSNNFGALARYRLPIMPFVLSVLYIIYKLSMKNRSSKETIPV